MERKPPLSDPQFDFDNDPVTEAVLHRDDTLLNGEILNEPEDVSENAFPQNQTFASSAITFPINFFYNGTNYSATVKKGWNTIPEYEVTSVMPVVKYLPAAFVITVPSKETFDFPVNETYYPQPFGSAVIESIKKECLARSVPLFE